MPAASILTWMGAALPQTADWMISHSVALAGGAAALALASEAMPALFPLRDTRGNYLAGIFGVAPEQVIPIGDGVQLWRETRKRTGDEEGSILPRGLPTLRGSYVILDGNAIRVICIHRVEELAVADGEEELPSAPFGLRTAGTAAIQRDTVPLEIEEDAIHRATLVEVMADRFGWAGAVDPVILLSGKDSGAVRSAIRNLVAGDVFTPAGQPVTALPMPEESGSSTIARPAGNGGWGSPEGRRDFIRWFRQQPRRATPKAKLLRRAVVAAACLALLASTEPATWIAPLLAVN